MNASRRNTLAQSESKPDELQLVRVEASPAELQLKQTAWDQYYLDALADCTDPNPDLCRDLALDKTIRALGRRPRAPLTPKEREDLRIQHEVAVLIQESANVRFDEAQFEREMERETRLRDEEAFENLLDEALAS